MHNEWEVSDTDDNMVTASKKTIEYLRGLTRLAIGATTGTTNLVETMHSTVSNMNPPLGESSATTTKGITRLVYRSIRGGTQLVGTSLDYAMQGLLPFLDDKGPPSRTLDVFLSVINGICGDQLVETENPLAIGMKLFYQKNELIGDQLSSSIGAPASKVMIFVHGLCMSHHGWEKDKINLSKEMAEKLGFTPVYLHYNTGRSIASNGAEFADRIESLMYNWPIPVTELTIVGHSMGGLVTRSARYHGEKKRHQWIKINKKLASIGTSHCGALLEKSAFLIETLMQLSPYAVPFTRLTKIRSTGIVNLRDGSVGANDEFIPLPVGVEYYALAAVLNKQSNMAAEQVIGDGFVTLDSALGQSSDAGRSLSIPPDNKWVGYEIGHNEMLWNNDVYKKLSAWL